MNSTLNVSQACFMPNRWASTLGQILFFFLIISAALRFKDRNNHKNKFPLHTGPPGLLLLGNLLQVPKTLSWERFATWKEKYGEHTLRKLASVANRAIENDEMLIYTSLQARRIRLTSQASTSL
jgi:hypothetical protein